MRHISGPAAAYIRHNPPVNLWWFDGGLFLGFPNPFRVNLTGGGERGVAAQLKDFYLIFNLFDGGYGLGGFEGFYVLKGNRLGQLHRLKVKKNGSMECTVCTVESNGNERAEVKWTRR